MSELNKSFLNKLGKGEVVTPYIEAALTYVRRNSSENNYTIDIDLSRESDFYFHPSSHCLPDERKLFYQLNPKYTPYLEPFNPSYVGSFAMAMGTAAHNIVQSHLVSSKVITQKEVEIKVFDEEKSISGHMDFLIPDSDGVNGFSPVELKTMNPYQFKFLNTPMYSWLCQFNVYMDVLGYDYGYIVVLEQATPYSLKEFKIEKDQKLIDSIYEKWDNVKQYIKDDVVPPFKCKDKNGDACYVGSKLMQDCPAKAVCLETFEEAISG